MNCPTLVSYRWPLAGSQRELQVADGCTPFLFRKVFNVVRVKLIFIGDILYYELDRRKITGWKSSLFEINPRIDLHPLTANADTPDWGYSDKTLQKTLSALQRGEAPADVDITIFILDVRIEDNYISRILPQNSILLTYHQMKEILRKECVPLENLLLSHIYYYSLLFRIKQGEYLMPSDEFTMAHVATRGCLFDFCGEKEDCVRSCVSPILCPSCIAHLQEHGLPVNEVEQVQRELKRIRRTFYDSARMFLNNHPYLSMLLTLAGTFIISIISNVIYCLIFENC